jgi:hypothetical protein
MFLKNGIVIPETCREIPKKQFPFLKKGIKVLEYQTEIPERRGEIL